MITKLKEGERLDDLQIKGYEIIQNPQKFCFGMDAVLLSDFAKVKPGEKVLDMGCGNGILPILLEAKNDNIKVTGLEIQEEMAEMARRSVLHNHQEDRVHIVTGDMKEAANIFGPVSFDVITSNPPYMIGQHGIRNPEEAKAIARHEIKCTLRDLLEQSAKLLGDKGRFYMVHRPFRLAEILSQMVEVGLEPKRMRLVYPYVDKEPNMVLIEGLRGGKSRIQIEPPLIVYEKDGSYTEELLRCYGMI